MAHTALLGVLVVATAIWVGGFVAIAVVARVARSTLQPAQQVVFFRGLGRSYGTVASVALAVALGTGAALVADRAWDVTLSAAAVVAAALVVTTVVGVAQARRMTRLRRRALDERDDAELAARLRRGASRAWVLRALIGGLSLALVALGVVVAA